MYVEVSESPQNEID